MNDYGKKHPLISAILSLIFPGAGQFYNEELIKGLILFTAAVAAFFSIVQSGVAIGNAMVNGAIFPPTNLVMRIVASGLIFFGLWLYGIIDGILVAQRSSTSNLADGKDEASNSRNKEGLIGLGVVLVIIGIFGFLHQLGLKFDLIIKYGWPFALILLGLYLLAKTTGLLKGGR